MVNKLIFKSVIDKYHLGENESVKWITRNKQLTVDFMSLNKEVIGYNGYNDPSEITELINKYIDRDGLFDSVIRNKLEGVYNDIGWSLNLNPFKKKFFNFS